MAQQQSLVESVTGSAAVAEVRNAMEPVEHDHGRFATGLA